MPQGKGIENRSGLIKVRAYPRNNYNHTIDLGLRASVARKMAFGNVKRAAVAMFLQHKVAAGELCSQGKIPKYVRI